MDHCRGARELPIVGCVANHEKVARKRLRIDAAPAGMKQHAPAGHRLDQRIQQPSLVEAAHTSEPDVSRSFPSGKKFRQR